MPKKYSSELKSKVIQSYRDGLPIDAVVQNYGVALSTVYRWIKEYKITCGNTESTPNYQMLWKQKKRLEHLIEIIGLSGILDETPLCRRLGILEVLYSQHNQ